MEPVRYRVAVADAHAHLFAVEAAFPGPFSGAVDVSLPVWTPGSYLVREFARHLQEVQAFDGEGAPLRSRKTDKSTWRVEASGAALLVLRYRVYANELTVRTSHLDATHGFFNGANLFFYRKEALVAPCELVLAPPAGWRVATSLPKRSPDIHQALDYQHLIDSPVEMGVHRLLRFEVERVPHELAIWGEGNFDEASLAADLARVCSAHARAMGGLPFKRYLFLLHLTDHGRGGLEHRDSTALLYPRFGFKPRKEYEEFLRLASHEYFHAWNVKRLKPAVFEPYDLSRESYTRALWAMEGFTEYYETMALARAGLLTRERLLAIFGEEITALLRTPGRKAQTLAESSFDTWIKFYRPDENSPNSSISYYRKGSLVALVLDLEIRAATRGARSLDDLMRLLLERHGASGAPEDAWAIAAAEVAGGTVAGLLDRYVESTAEIDFAAHLARAGIRFHLRPAESAEDKGGKKPRKGQKTEGEPFDGEARVWLGFDVRHDRGRVAVTQVATGSPALSAGLYAGDEILAVDGWRAIEKGWRARVQEHRPGDRVSLTVFRRDRLLELGVVAAAPPADTAWLEADPDAAPEAKAILEGWAAGALPA